MFFDRIPSVLLVFVSCAVLALAGCSDRSGRRGTTDGGGGGTGCADLSGSWAIGDHCEAAFVGQPMTVDQSGCAFTVGGVFDGFAGTVGSGGSLSVTGSVEGETITCTGSATTTVMDMTCNGDCDVRITR